MRKNQIHCSGKKLGSIQLGTFFSKIERFLQFNDVVLALMCMKIEAYWDLVLVLMIQYYV